MSEIKVIEVDENIKALAEKLKFPSLDLLCATQHNNLEIDFELPNNHKLTVSIELIGDAAWKENPNEVQTSIDDFIE